MKLKEAISSTDSKSHVFNTLQYPGCYVIYHNGKHWLHSIYTGWEKRREYKGHTATLEICTWTTAATLKLPFKIRLLPIDNEHIFMGHDEVIKRYG